MMDNTTPPALHSPAVAFALLSYYSPEPEPYPQTWTKGRLLDRWLRIYPEQWICWALIESIYQGRYKIYCVEQILALWLRRGEPRYHFNPEFEAMICHNVPQRTESTAITKPDRTVATHPPALSIGGEEMNESATPQPVEGASTVFSEPVDSPAETESLSPQSATEASNIYWVDAFELPAQNTQEFDLASVLSRHQLLPFTFNRIGLEPIHRFMPEAEPIEFCEKLEAIAAHQESARHP